MSSLRDMLGNELFDLVNENRGETRNIEFKRSMSWNDLATKIKITKSVLAMSNIRDGGKIILGFDQDGDRFVPVGMSSEHEKSFKSDDVCAFIYNYAEPYAQLILEHITHDNKRFVIISVKEFDEVPIICKKDYIVKNNNKDELRRGKLYVRTRRIPESAELSTLEDLREIIELATYKGISKLVNRTSKDGSAPAYPDNIKPFNEQLENFIQEENIQLMKLMSKGYYTVIIRPTIFEKERLQLQQCEDDVIKSIVALRDYLYPHYYGGAYQNNINRGINFVQGYSNISPSMRFIEPPISIWRMYQSGQFIHYFALMEDYWPRTAKENALGLNSTLWSLTEIYEFASRLAMKNVFDSDVSISIELHALKDRQLIERSSTNISTDLNYTGYKLSVPNLPYSKILSVPEIIGEHQQLALKHMVWILERFGYYSIESNELDKRQRELFELKSRSFPYS